MKKTCLKKKKLLFEIFIKNKMQEGQYSWQEQINMFSLMAALPLMI